MIMRNFWLASQRPVAGGTTPEPSTETSRGNVCAFLLDDEDDASLLVVVAIVLLRINVDRSNLNCRPCLADVLAACRETWMGLKSVDAMICKVNNQEMTSEYIRDNDKERTDKTVSYWTNTARKDDGRKGDGRQL